MRNVRLINKAAEVLFNLLRILGGNWSAVFALVESAMDLHALWQEPRMAQAV